MNELSPHLSDATLREAERMLSEGGTAEGVLVFLQRSGANAIASIRALVRLLGVSVPEAQEILYESETWRDTR